MAIDYTANPTDVKNFTTTSEVNLDQSFQDYSEFLPSINRTESLQRFFGATVNQLLSSGSTQTIDAYWGRLAGRNYNPDNELFQPEISANRINYQFQPGVVSRLGGDVEQTTSYINWLDRIESLGADLDNHDRIFSEPGYVLDLPINADMFINYRNYYWLEGEIPLIEIEATITDPIDIDDIVAQSQYTTPDLGNYKTVEFVNGIRVKFTGLYVSSTSGDYNVDSIYYVENVGGRGGIKLVEIEDASGNILFPETSLYRVEPREGWDTVDYDATPWDGTADYDDYDLATNASREDLALNKSYIVMERWAQDKNPWARTNKWFSIYALRAATEYNELTLEAYLNTRTRADRPIVEFHANLELYNTCKTYVETLDYVIDLNQVTDMISGRPDFLIDSENAVQNGDIILVAKEEIGGIELVDFNGDFNDDFDAGAAVGGSYSSSFSLAYNLGVQGTFYEDAFIVSGVGTNITLSAYSSYNEDEYIIVGKGTEKGTIFCFKNGEWSVAQNKENRGDAPLFKLYDQDLVDLEAFDNNDFLGDLVFGYEVTPGAQFDRELGFSPTFTDQGSFNNFKFSWTLSNQRYNQNVTVDTQEEIVGYYFYHNWIEDEYLNGWSNIQEGQRVPVIQTQIADGVSTVEFELGTSAVGRSTEYTVALENNKFRWHSHSYIDRNTIGYANPDFIWKYDTNYTINDLISVDASKLEMTDPFGNADGNITYSGTDTLKTFSVASAYVYDKVLYRKSDETNVYGEIFLSNSNQNRYGLTKNGQRLVEDVDFTYSGTTLTVTATTVENDVIELRYIPDSDLTDVVYDVAPVHFYNNDNNPFNGAGYDDLINHFILQVGAMPGLEGKVSGTNNYHKTFRKHTYDGLIRQQIFRTKHIQYLLDQEDINPIRALKSFSRDYVDFKKSFRSKVSQLWQTESWNTTRELVDRALSDINIGKNESFKYSHSDMLYYKQARSTTYIIGDSTTTFALPELINRYGDTQNHIQAYLTETVAEVGAVVERPLTLGVDYTIEGPNLELATAVVSTNIVNALDNVVNGPDNVVLEIGTNDSGTSGAILTIRWYDYTQHSHVPFSAVKLGFFKPTQIEIVDGELIGHDGSRYTLTNTNVYDLTSVDFDPVAAALWDFELRIINNLVPEHFVDDKMGQDMISFYPNPVGEFSYSVADMNARLDDWYNRYAVRNGITEIDQVDYNAGDEFTWNYNTVGPELGSWRSLYTYEFGTDRPHTHPWEMLGHHIKPTWWDATYSWTAGALRTALEDALLYGITGNALTPSYSDIRYARPNYDWANDTLVSSDGNATLIGPVTANVVATPTAVAAAQDFVFGDWSETENRWRKSSEYLFALAEVYLQLKPYRLHEIFWKLDQWNVNTNVTQEQWVDPDTCQRLHINELHNQLIEDGIIGKISVVTPGTGYTYLDLEFKTNDLVCYRTASAVAYTNAGQAVGVAITDPGRGFDNDPVVELTGPIASTGVELEYVLDFNFIVTHLGFNTLPSEEYRTQESTTNALSERLDGLEINYTLHVGGYTDKRILNIEIDGDYESGLIRIPESSYDIKIDRNAPIKTAFYSGVKITKIEGSGYQVDGYDLDSTFFNFLPPSTAGTQVGVEIGGTEVVKYLKWHNNPTRIPYGTRLLKRQELYQFLLGLGKYYESLGFDNYSRWEEEARLAIIWALDSVETEPHYVNGIDGSLFYNQGSRGVVQQIDINYDGVSNVLDSEFKNIRRNELLVLRDNEMTEISMKGGDDRIYGVGVRVVEFEHIVAFDNVTTFNDPIYQPELGLGQNRVRLIGERTRNWNGRVEAPGYMVQDTGLILNMENSVHELETEWVSAESKALERLTRQTIGFNAGYSKPTYMTNLFIGDKTAYRFEKGKRKYQGTESAIAAMTRNKNIFGSEFEHELYEEWLVRLGEYGDVSESRPLQFAIDPNQIKTDPQHFRFSEQFVSDKSEDLIIDLHKGAANSISGTYDSPFSIYDVLPLDNTSIQNLEQYQDFTRDAGLPIVDEVDYFLGSIDDIGDIYDPTAPYALVPNWSSTTAYVQGELARLYGKVYRLAIDATGLTDVQGDIVVRGTQIFPQVASGLTFIANGTTVNFSKDGSSITYDNIQLQGTVVNPTVPSGDTLVLDGINVNFIKDETTTTYSDIVLEGGVTGPDILNSASRTLEIYYANSASPTLMTTVTVTFNELNPELTMQTIWNNALGDAITTAGGATVSLTETNARIVALDALRAAYIAAGNTTTAWQTRMLEYYDEVPGIAPDRFLNPEYWGTQILAAGVPTWQSEAEALMQLDLDLIADIGGAHSEDIASMTSGSLNSAGTWNTARDAANDLLDYNNTVSDNNQNLQDYRTFITIIGSTFSAGQLITVTNPINYVLDDITAIANKIAAALTLAGAPGDITVSPAGNIITLTRTNNAVGYRLGVENDTDLGFTGVTDVQTQGTTSTISVPLTLSEAVIAINNFSITGVTAQIASNQLRIVSTNEQLVVGTGSANNDFGINQGTYNATANTVPVLVDLAIGDVVTQINDASITDLVASQVEGALLLSYAGDQLIIGDGTSNTELGIIAQTYESQTDSVSNVFNADEWDVVQDPANFNVWTIDNIGSNTIGSVSTTNRYDVLQTMDLQIGILEVCAGSENGDDALIQCDTAHTLAVGDYVLLVNTTSVPSLDGIYQVTTLQSDTGFYVDRYIEQKGFTGKVFPMRSVRFPSSTVAEAAMSDTDYIQDGLGLRSGTYVYVDEVFDGGNNGLGYGAVYQVQRTTGGAGLVLVRNETGKTNNSTIKNGVLYSNSTGETVVRFEIYDPLKGIIPGIAAAELDLRSDVDFAYYTDSTDPELEIRPENAWGNRQVGTTWWDLSNAIYLNYDQSSTEYRQEQWGQLFPTATIDVYEWTKSSETPDDYLTAVQAGTIIDGVELTGQPYQIEDQFGDVQYNWCEEMEVNRNTNQIETYYYFWVKNKTTTPTLERQYSVLQIADIIIDPTTQAVDWLAATSENTLLVSSLSKSNGFDDLVMQVNYDANASDYHQEFALLAENDPALVIPEWLHISLRDSLAGFTQDTTTLDYTDWDSVTTYSPESIVLSALGKYYRSHTESTNINPDGDTDQDYWSVLEFNENNPDGLYTGVDTVKINTPQTIPDRNLHPSVRYGIETRPHQIWFQDLEKSRKVAVDKLNDQLTSINLVDSDIPWREEFERSFFVGDLEYDITQYWNFVDWNLEGTLYENGTGDYFVEFVNDLSALTPSEGELAQVERSIDPDGRSRRSVWVYSAGEWSIVYKEKATIKFNNLLWNNESAATGWDIVGWDTDEWDKSSSAVMVEIFDSFYNRIWVEERRSFYADLWFDMVKHVLHEQREPDWIFKSSYFKLIVEDTLEKQYNKYFTENADEFFDFVDVVKPFRSKLRDGIVRKVADDEINTSPLDTIEVRVQTNPVNEAIDETNTRSFRLTVGSDGLNYSSQIVNEHKVLLGIDIGPDDLIIPILNIGTNTIPETSGAIWINSERIEYTSTSFTDASGIGSGFTSGFDVGFGGVTLLVGITRGTQGTFARGHSYADIVEDATNLDLVENTTLSDYGTTTTGATDNLAPAWNELGDGLLEAGNLDPNGITIRGEAFGTIDPYGEILYAQWLIFQETAEAIENFQGELEQLIEEFWIENYPWLSADTELPSGTTTRTAAVPHDSVTTSDSDYYGVTADGTAYKADNTKD